MRDQYLDCVRVYMQESRLGETANVTSDEIGIWPAYDRGETTQCSLSLRLHYKVMARTYLWVCAMLWLQARNGTCSVQYPTKIGRFRNILWCGNVEFFGYDLAKKFEYCRSIYSTKMMYWFGSHAFLVIIYSVFNQDHIREKQHDFIYGFLNIMLHVSFRYFLRFDHSYSYTCAAGSIFQMMWKSLSEISIFSVRSHKRKWVLFVSIDDVPIWVTYIFNQNPFYFWSASS